MPNNRLNLTLPVSNNSFFSSNFLESPSGIIKLIPNKLDPLALSNEKNRADLKNEELRNESRFLFIANFFEKLFGQSEGKRKPLLSDFTGNNEDKKYVLVLDKSYFSLASRVDHSLKKEIRKINNEVVFVKKLAKIISQEIPFENNSVPFSKKEDFKIALEKTLNKYLLREESQAIKISRFKRAPVIGGFLQLAEPVMSRAAQNIQIRETAALSGVRPPSLARNEGTREIMMARRDVPPTSRLGSGLTTSDRNHVYNTNDPRTMTKKGRVKKILKWAGAAVGGSLLGDVAYDTLKLVARGKESQPTQDDRTPELRVLRSYQLKLKEFNLKDNSLDNYLKWLDREEFERSDLSLDICVYECYVKYMSPRTISPRLITYFDQLRLEREAFNQENTSYLCNSRCSRS